MPRPSGARRWKRASANSANGIRDEVVRRYYRQDLAERLQRTFAPEGGRGGYGQGQFPRGRGRRITPPFCPAERLQPGPGRPIRPPRRPRAGGGAGPGDRPGPYQAASPQLATSPIMRGQRSAMSRREALILQSLINHPWLLHDHLEEVAMLELAHPEATKLRAGIIAAFANDHHHSPDVEEQAEKMRADLEARGLSEVLQRVERAITTSAVWGAKPGAAREDVLATWQQLVVLHQKTHALLREKKDAELALGEEPTEANLAWLKDVERPAGVARRHGCPDRGFWRTFGPVPEERLIKK